MTQFFTTLLPSFLMHMALIVVLVHAFWWAWAKFAQHSTYSWKGATILGIAISAIFTADTMMKAYQNNVLAQAARQPSSVGPTNPLEVKAEFLKNIDILAGNPDQVTDQIRAQLFENFRSLFPQGAADLVTYRDEIKKSYQCHYHLYKDALDSIEKGRKVKSSETILCESYAGNFFNREKLISPEMIQAQNNLVEKYLSKNKDPNERLPTKEELKTHVSQLKTRLDSVEKIFR